MTQHSASCQAQDPLTWHLRYWLNLLIIGSLRGEDEELLTFRVEMEWMKLDSRLKDQLYSNWVEYKKKKLEASYWFWQEMTVESEEAKWYMSDIDTMLMDKVQKARDFLDTRKSLLRSTIQAWKFEEALELCHAITSLTRKLEEEAIRENTEARYFQGSNLTLAALVS